MVTTPCTIKPVYNVPTSNKPHSMETSHTQNPWLTVIKDNTEKRTAMLPARGLMPRASRQEGSSGDGVKKVVWPPSKSSFRYTCRLV